MNLFRPLFTYPAALAWLGFAVAFYPLSGHAQQPDKGRARPVARPTVSPTPKPTPTPPVIIAVPHGESREPTSTPDPSKEGPVNETEIDASDGATFASKDRIAVFSGNVRVTDPRFQLACDKLTVFLNKSASTDTAVPAAVGGPTPPPLAAGSTPPPLAIGGDKPSTPAPGNTPPAPAAKGQGGGGGIDHCIAEGHVIILQKRAPTKPGEEEKVSIGRGEKGTFDNKTGDMVLTGLPEIEQNGNSHAATSPDTVMTIHKDSSLDTKGPSKTVLIQHKGGSSLELPGAPAVPSGNGAGGKPKKNKPGATPQGSPSASHTSFHGMLPG